MLQQQQMGWQKLEVREREREWPSIPPSNRKKAKAAGEPYSITLLAKLSHILMHPITKYPKKEKKKRRRKRKKAKPLFHIYLYDGGGDSPQTHSLPPTQLYPLLLPFPPPPPPLSPPFLLLFIILSMETMYLGGFLVVFFLPTIIQ